MRRLVGVNIRQLLDDAPRRANDRNARNAISNLDTWDLLQLRMIWLHQLDLHQPQLSINFVMGN